MTEAPLDTAELLEIPSARGPIACAYSAPPEGARGPAPVVLMVGGGDGGLDGPLGLYPALARDLLEAGLGSLRVDFRIHRFPGPVDEGVHDLQAAIEWLAARGIQRAGLLGHSFGGAVVIEAAADDPARVASIATLATQTAGAQRVAELAPRPILFVHGLNDIRLSPDCSRYLHSLAGEPKKLVLLEGATHSLRQRHPEVRALLVEWFASTLGADGAASSDASSA